jgi:hypothetical protein
MESLNASSGHICSRQAHHEGGPVIKQYRDERIVDIKGQKVSFQEQTVTTSIRYENALDLIKDFFADGIQRC